MKGTIVGSYRIVDALSVGGMGTVYRAEHTLIGRLAAVKILHPELCTNRDIVNRFFNEAKTTTSIKHPGIVEVFDFGYMASGHAYLIMEFLEGMPLSHRVRTRGAIPEGEAAMVLRGVCIALSAAHDKGVVHRDLKPDNIFVIPDPDSALGERTKILDFGIAKLTDIGLAGTATKTGAVMGTPTYMSPEQCRGTGDVDFRADLYSIGCMFYELVSGRPPFVNTGAGELIGSHLFVEPEPPSRHIQGLSASTEALIMRLLAKQPERRVQTAKELAQLLTGIAQQHGWLTAGDVSWSSLNHITAVPPSPHAMATPVVTPGSPHAAMPSSTTPAHRTPAQHAAAHLTPAHMAPAGVPHMPQPGASHTPPPPAHPTPAAMLHGHLAPASMRPATLTPASASLGPPTMQPAARLMALPMAGQPTTLSGAATAHATSSKLSPRRVRIAIAGGLLAAAAGITAIIAFTGSSDKPASPAAQPAAHIDTPPAPPAVETPAVTPPATPPMVATPAVTPPTAPPAITPPVEAPPAVADQPAIGKPTVDKPAAGKPAADKPAADKPAADKPAATIAHPDATPTTRPAADKPAADVVTHHDVAPAAKPATLPATRPGKPAKKPAKGEHKDLLEQDI